MKLITPSKIPFLIIGIFLDITSLFFPIFDFIVPGGGQFLSWVWDFVGFFTIGLWVIFVSGLKESKNVWAKIMGTTLVESIPYVGEICPSWTFLVLSTKVGGTEEIEDEEEG